MTFSSWFPWLNRFVLLASLFFFHSSWAQDALKLEDLIALAQKKSETLLSIDRSIQSLEADIRSRDLDLSAQFSSEISQIRDHRESLTSSSRFEDSSFIDVTLEKPFSTGTSISLNSGYTLSDTSTSATQNVTDWEIRLSQSLWRNAFGRGTDYRRRSDQAELKARRFEAEFQKQALVTNLEAIYWDLALSLREEEIRLANIRLSETLEKWTRDRVRRSAAESSDLLQVQALSSDRKLALITTRNRISELKNQLQQLIPDLDVENLKLDLKSLEFDRNLNTLLFKNSGSGTPVRLDSVSQNFLLAKSQAELEQVKDDLSPLLDAYVSYGQNGIDPRFSDSWQETSRGSHTDSQVGILFSIDLDQDLKEDRRMASRLQVESQSLQAQALSRASILEWTDLQRNISNLKAQAKEAKLLAQFQKRKSQEERRRYRLGRTTVFQTVAFEVDSATAELRLYQILADLRKSEARARSFFIAEGEG